MPLEKKARVPVRGHVSSFARILERVTTIFFLFFFLFLLLFTRNFDKEETQKQEHASSGGRGGFLFDG